MRPAGRGMRLAETDVPLRARLLLLGLWALLGVARGSPDRPSWHYASAEVVVPRKHAHAGRGPQPRGSLSYSLRFGGQRRIIHLRRKTRLLPGRLPVMTQNDQGALQVEYPYIPLDCDYIGYVQDAPDSMVTIDACYGGLEGIIKLGDLTYEIKPLNNSLTFEHTVSQIVLDTHATEPRHRPGEREDSQSDGASIAAVPRVPTKVYLYHPATVTCSIICSHEAYRYLGGQDRTLKYMKKLGGSINSILQNAAMIFPVVSLIVYDQQDPVAMTDFSRPGGAIFQYFQRTIYPTTRTSVTLLLLKSGPDELQHAPDMYTTCSDQGLIYINLSKGHTFQLAVIGAQQVGRAFGLHYDGPHCKCQRRATCVMTKFAILTDAFSNCSYADLAEAAGRASVECHYLLNYTHSDPSLTKHFCGNRIVEGQESCDCGSFKQCYSNPCCQSSCAFTAGSVCDGQACCANCTYAPEGTLCRAIVNVCDLPEYCQGNAFTCPNDLYLQNGSPCSEEGYCYNGNCTDRTMHCREIFGRNAQKGDDVCYKINLKANRFGFCSREPQKLTFQACAERDIHCGRLQCSNVTHLPRLDEHVSFHQSKFEDSWCFGVDQHRGAHGLDPGYVRDGTPCAPRKMCRAHSCNTTMEELDYDCTPSKCNFKGLCNNKKQCHCHIGWGPPECRQRGAGGSVDSGPPPSSVRNITQSQGAVNYLRVIFGRLYAFIAVLLFGVATKVQTVKTVAVEQVNQPQQH